VALLLRAIAEDQGPAAVRLRRWLEGLVAIKRRKALDAGRVRRDRALPSPGPRPEWRDPHI
jgi:hypothetical protein